MNQLEKLLNTLLKMGWKPFSESIIKVKATEDGIKFYKKDKRYSKIYFEVSLREIVILESGLWQICTERELMKSKTSEHLINRYVKELITREEGNFVEADVLCTDLDPEWRLIESALVPEEDLVKFLLDNIEIEGGL